MEEKHSSDHNPNDGGSIMPAFTKSPSLIGVRFTESMSGYAAEGISDFEDGLRIGTMNNGLISFSVTVTIDDIDEFCGISGRQAKIEGTVTCLHLGKSLPIRDGRFSLFRPDDATGERRMTYSFSFTATSGKDYFLYGYKVISTSTGAGPIEDMTKLFTRIYQGSSVDDPLFAAGILRFRLMSLPTMMTSFEVTGSHSIIDKIGAIKKFFEFCYDELTDTYLVKMNPLYHADYENLVITGRLDKESAGKSEFLLFSGVHDKGFPWGDGEVFWDVGLVIKTDGRWERYAITDRVLEGLRIDIRKGQFSYSGPLFRIREGHQVSFSDLHGRQVPAHLEKCDCRIEIDFAAEQYDTINVPFAVLQNYRRIVPHDHVSKIEELMPHLRGLGWHLNVSSVLVTTGKIAIQTGSSPANYCLIAQEARGEAERSVIDNIKWPKLYYKYFCAISNGGTDNAGGGRTRVQVTSDVLRADRKDHILDEIQQQLGKIINHLAFLDLEIEGNVCRILPHDDTRPLSVIDADILEINNDHFPTAVFQRRVVSARDEQGNGYLAMEEDMEVLNLGPVNSIATAIVAAIKDNDKLRALDGAIEASRFFSVLDEAWQRSGKTREDFSIIIKPNFMFIYNVKDTSTYTDPELVEHLIDRIYDKGFRTIAVGEARSTYGVFYTNREVVTVGHYIGLTENKYSIVDLSLDLEPYTFAGKLGSHYVNRQWKSADFRISFAKNKTHVYAMYTLALKCMYGALPMENKFKEYHHDRDIFSTTIEFMKHFPAHFAFIDAFISADGPFGIFADKEPNRTETVIASENLVACDWIGAAKMGLDPMDSDYMKQAVDAFGKPRIKLVGDRTIYPDWVNVGDMLSWGALNVIDRQYYFGNLFYSVMSYMEPFFQYKEESVARRIGKVLALPIQKEFFQTVTSGRLDLELNRKLWNLFTQEE
jgi:uncharacterized protein (DUF362 family)